ncbi:MAG: hypothetical protein K2Y09_03835 [Nitrosomonas sp.]|uniref:hypothetical protein n=1 Tax=Nitrosomonas sp. TaxID=42353 RepID=UPI001E02EA21|nr:hypothetical protein [Nitrosomonas sp.]MBX9894296.1 hypothetical protein [Nitrosomonas sp.]
MKLKLYALLGAVSAAVFLSACTSLPQAPEGYIKAGKSHVYWIDPATGKKHYVYRINQETSKQGGYLIPGAAWQKATALKTGQAH